MSKQSGEKKAILVVSFGTSYRDTCERNIGAIEADIASALPDWEVRRAFTSARIINKLRERDGVAVDTVGEALERLAREGFMTVALQPTHILNGEEYDDIVEDAADYADRFHRFVIGDPLLTDTEDYQALARVFSERFPAAEDTAVCLMGHGSEHFADSAYAALDYHLKDRGRADMFVGTVEGFPDLETLLRHVRASGAKRVVLTPLMVVAGDHAVNDMAGDGEDSWKTAFSQAGYEVACVLRGIGEYPEARALYAGHARAAAGTALVMPVA